MAASETQEREERDPDGAGSPFVTVIIPVWNDAEGLRRCLSALAEQTFPVRSMQVLVVDNGSTDQSRIIAAGFPFVSILVEKRRGSYRARNRGLAAAAGDFVAFLDSDCEPAPGWLCSALAAATEPDIGIVAGRVVLAIDSEPVRSPSTVYESLFAFDQRSNAAAGLCVTANWLSRRSLLKQLGGFDGELASGGDIELSQRIAAAGYRVCYAADAVVRHPARSRLSALVAKRRRLVGGQWQVSSGNPVRSLRTASFLSRRFLGETRRTLLVEGLGLRPKSGTLGVIAVLWAASMLELLRLSLGGTPRRS